jgi:hypothetical protein
MAFLVSFLMAAILFAWAAFLIARGYKLRL